MYRYGLEKRYKLGLKGIDLVYLGAAFLIIVTVIYGIVFAKLWTFF